MNYIEHTPDRKGDPSDVTAFVTGELSLRQIKFNRSTRRAIVECTVGGSSLRLIVRGRALQNFKAFEAAALDLGVVPFLPWLERDPASAKRCDAKWRLTVAIAIHRGRVGS